VVPFGTTLKQNMRNFLLTSWHGPTGVSPSSLAAAVAAAAIHSPAPKTAAAAATHSPSPVAAATASIHSDKS
jgi:hypothetical protein